jgi:hypothetical protein
MVGNHFDHLEFGLTVETLRRWVRRTEMGTSPVSGGLRARRPAYSSGPWLLTAGGSRVVTTTASSGGPPP